MSKDNPAGDEHGRAHGSADAARAAAPAPINVGDPVTVKGSKTATRVTEVVKDQAGTIKGYRCEVESDAPHPVGTPAARETKLFKPADVKLSEPEPELPDETVEKHKPGDAVIAKGGERGSVVAVVENPDDAAACKYQVAFGGTLGTLQVSGADLMKVPKPT